jgi:tetratricopeptide (TPR) repeat protein
VRIWLLRLGVVATVLALASGLWSMLAPRGLGWVPLTLVGLLVAFVAIELVLRARRRAHDDDDADRWRAALTDARARPAVIAELRRRIDRARLFGPRLRLEHARLSIVLAELHQAAGKHDEALATLARVSVGELEPLEAAVVRHARAQAYLAADDVEGAEVALLAAPEEAGDAVLDASLTLARAAVRLGRGEVDEAQARAQRIADLAEEGDELHDEALALLARCQWERGAHDEARASIARIDDAGRARLRALGPALLRVVLEP